MSAKNESQTSMKSVFKKLMTSALLLSAVAGCTVCWAAGLPFVKDFTVEAKEARSKDVPILVLFMSESCEYCETVLKQFLLPMQRDPEYDGKVILRQIESGSNDPLMDFHGEATTYSKFARKHKVWGTPHVMLFDSEGNVLTSIEGLLTVDYYYAFLVDAINESLEKVKAATLSRRRSH